MNSWELLDHERITIAIQFAERTGRCPLMCGRQRARTPAGALTITCGDPACQSHWLPGGKRLPIRREPIRREST